MLLVVFILINFFLPRQVIRSSVGKTTEVQGTVLSRKTVNRNWEFVLFYRGKTQQKNRRARTSHGPRVNVHPARSTEPPPPAL